MNRGDTEVVLVRVAAEFTGGESGIGEETGMREGEAGVRCGQGNSWPNMDGLRAGFRRADFFASPGDCARGGTWILRFAFLGNLCLA